MSPSDKLDTIQLEVRDALSLCTSLKKKSVDLILTDFPYQVAKPALDGIPIGEYPVQQSRMNTKTAPWDLQFELTEELLDEFHSILRPGGTLIAFYDIWKFETLRSLLRRVCFKSLRLIVWSKTNGVPVCNFTHYRKNSKEFAVVAIKGKNPTFHSAYDSGIYVYPHQNRSSIGVEHPTMKNLDMHCELLKKHTNEGDLVVDPFLGSGITAFACLLEGRRCIGGDIEESYVRAAEANLERFL